MAHRTSWRSLFGRGGKDRDHHRRTHSATRSGEDVASNRAGFIQMVTASAEKTQLQPNRQFLNRWKAKRAAAVNPRLSDPDAVPSVVLSPPHTRRSMPVIHFTGDFDTFCGMGVPLPGDRGTGKFAAARDSLASCHYNWPDHHRTEPAQVEREAGPTSSTFSNMDHPTEPIEPQSECARVPDGLLLSTQSFTGSITASLSPICTKVSLPFSREQAEDSLSLSISSGQLSGVSGLAQPSGEGGNSVGAACGEEEALNTSWLCSNASQVSTDALSASMVSAGTGEGSSFTRSRLMRSFDGADVPSDVGNFLEIGEALIKAQRRAREFESEAQRLRLQLNESIENSIRLERQLAGRGAVQSPSDTFYTAAENDGSGASSRSHTRNSSTDSFKSLDGAPGSSSQRTPPICEDVPHPVAQRPRSRVASSPINLGAALSCFSARERAFTEPVFPAYGDLEPICTDWQVSCQTPTAQFATLSSSTKDLSTLWDERFPELRAARAEARRSSEEVMSSPASTVRGFDDSEEGCSSSRHPQWLDQLPPSLQSTPSQPAANPATTDGAALPQPLTGPQGVLINEQYADDTFCDEACGLSASEILDALDHATLSTLYYTAPAAADGGSVPKSP